MIKMTYKAVMFDADETIFNNQGIHEIVTEKVLIDLGLTSSLANEVHEKWDEHYFAEQRRRVDEHGFCIDRENNAHSLMLALKEFNIELSIEQANDFWKYMVSEYSTKSKPYPDAIELLKFLQDKRIKMGIVSNGDTDIINMRLEKAMIDHYFEFVIAPCHDYRLSKPDVKVFTESLDLLNVTPKQSIFVGDNPNSDIVGANRAGMFSVLIDRYQKMEELEGLKVPKLKISSLTELKVLFE
ncbi:MAG: HAD family hydrolase [Asgard group archaeon]|nr:HAD family hydrolase [Asgard group archaeon]